MGNGLTNIKDWYEYNGGAPITPCGYGNTLGNEIFKAMGNFSSEEKDVLKEENNKEGEE